MTNARLMASRLEDLLRREQHDLAEFVVALAEFDRRKGWLELGYTSLFYFLHRDLGLSKGAAHYRKTAARLVQDFPQIVEPLRDGRLCLTSVAHLARVLTAENAAEVLPRFFQKSKRDAAAVAAAIAPAAVVPRREVVTAVRAAEPVQPVEPRSGVRRESTDPLTADLSRLHLTVSKRFLEKLEAARAALSHVRPDANAETVLEAGLDLILRAQQRRRGVVESPRNDKGNPDATRVPAAVRRQVWTRDGGRCQWPLESGGICGSNLRVEFDHVIPRALGGRSTPENIRLLCRFHNDVAARRTFGDEWMNQFTGHPRAPRAGPPS